MSELGHCHAGDEVPRWLTLARSCSTVSPCSGATRAYQMPLPSSTALFTSPRVARAAVTSSSVVSSGTLVMRTHGVACQCAGICHTHATASRQRLCLSMCQD